MAMGGSEGGGGDSLEKTLDFRMQELNLSTNVGPPPIGLGDSSPSGEAQNTSDRRTDPNMSSNCLCGVIELQRESVCGKAS